MSSSRSSKEYRPPIAEKISKLPLSDSQEQELAACHLKRKEGVLVYTGAPAGDIPDDVVQTARDEHARELLS